MKSKSLSKSEIRELNQRLLLQFGQAPFDKRDRISIAQDEHVLYLRDNQAVLAQVGSTVFPLLPDLLVMPKEIVVDMGAIKFLVAGADLMRPGIVSLDRGICEGDVVVARDVTHKKPLMIGLALYCSRAILSMEKGKVAKNLHYIGDRLYGKVNKA